MTSAEEVLNLPAARGRVRALAPFKVSAVASPDEARRFVAIVTRNRTIIAGLKCERRRFASAEFVAKILNESDEPVSCALTGRTYRGLVYVQPGHFWIDPQTMARIPIHVPFRFPFRTRTLSLHLQNASMHACAEAEIPAPPIVKAGRLVALIALLIAGSLAALQGIRPNVAAYALPDRVAAGDRVTGSYALSGVGEAEYTVSADGEQIYSGLLESRSGSFSFPTQPGRKTYDVDVLMSGPFGSARRELLVSAVPVSSTTTVAIQALQPEPSVVRSGQKFEARYLADADTGNVTLFDASNIPIARAPYNVSGSSTLVAPTVNIPTQYRIELQVSIGAKSSSASAGLLVLPKGGASPQNLHVPVVPTAASAFHIEPAYVTSSMPFAIHLLIHPSRLRVTLENNLGTPLASKAVAPNQDTVSFVAPHVVRPNAFVIVASYWRGSQEQALVQQVLIHPMRTGAYGAW
jgi:hypothetical protein